MTVSSRRSTAPRTRPPRGLAEAATPPTVVLWHVQPDADALGSALALAEGLRRRAPGS